MKKLIPKKLVRGEVKEQNCLFPCFQTIFTDNPIACFFKKLNSALFLDYL